MKTTVSSSGLIIIVFHCNEKMRESDKNCVRYSTMIARRIPKKKESPVLLYFSFFRMSAVLLSFDFRLSKVLTVK